MQQNQRNLAILIGLCGAALLAGTPSASAQDWPQWRGLNRDAKAAGFTVPKTWPQQLTQKWKITAGRGVASPSVAGDKVYLFVREGETEVIRCLEAATGKEVWHDQYDTQATTGAAARFGSGPRSSPAVAEGKVVTLGVRGILSCYDAASGKKLWSKDEFQAWPNFFVASSPMIVDGLCIAQLGGRANGALVAYTLATGEQKWKCAGESPGYASPVVLTVEGAKLIIAETERSLIAVTLAEGKQVWTVPFAPAGMGYNAATPIVNGATLIYAGQGRGAKAVKFTKQGDSFTTTELWSNPDNAVQFNTPVLKNGLLFGLSMRGNLFCLNAETGKMAWTESQGGLGAYGSIVDAGQVMLALAAQSPLLVFEPTDKEYKQLASIKVAEKDSYAYPAVAGNRIYVKDVDSLTCWSVE
jgi:outer membrane protein assembly factor BamB